MHKHKVRRIAVLFAFACALFSAMAAPAAAAEATHVFVPHYLQCIDYEDYWPDWKDEIYFTYGVNEHYADMTTGDRTYPGQLTFTGNQLRVEVFEWDRGKRYSLGSAELNTHILYQEQQVHFSASGWDYLLVYHMQPA